MVGLLLFFLRLKYVHLLIPPRIVPPRCQCTPTPNILSLQGMIQSVCIVTLRQIMHLVVLYDRFDHDKVYGSTFDAFIHPQGFLPTVMHQIILNVQRHLQNVHQALPISIYGPKLSHCIQILETRRKSHRHHRTTTALDGGRHKSCDSQRLRGVHTGSSRVLLQILTSAWNSLLGWSPVGLTYQ